MIRRANEGGKKEGQEQKVGPKVEKKLKREEIPEKWKKRR